METTVLGNRYELIEKVGGGGMANVYKAKCRLLNRFVAVKILREEFTGDEEFVKRFGIEAQSAASLTHPNIVSIYDVGNENNTYYIVMEYVDGGYTLKEHIASKGVIGPQEAVKIAIQICSAIEQAHSKQIIHRDIKPQNILMTKDGIAKVTDFGIARAATSSTITIVGSTIGSVHYFSPEQARGGYIDEKSDLYSLGIVIYEMITGKMPFDGETPVAVALKHIQDTPVQPLEIRNDIPKALNDLVMKAIRKEQSSRYQSASEMLSDLYRVLEEPNGDFAVIGGMDINPTRKMKAIDTYELTKEEEYDIKANKRNQKTQKHQKHQKHEKHEKPTKGDRVSVWLAVFISIIVIGAFSYIAYGVIVNSMAAETKKFIVKNYQGKDFNLIVDELKDANIEVIEHWIFDSEIEKNIIIKQSVQEGSEFKIEGYNSIEFQISKGPKTVIIPELLGKESRKAEIDLKQLNLKPKIVDEYSDIIAIDHVIGTYPKADEEVEPETEIIIYKSIGPEIKTVTVPDLTKRTYTEAQVILGENKLRVGTLYPEGRSPGSAKIIKQVPESGATVNEDTPINMYFEQTKYVSIPLKLKTPGQYSDYVRVVAQITTSDTNETRIFSERSIQKEYFPVTIEDIPIPEGGSTKLRILLDDSLYMEMNLIWDDIE